MARGRFISKQIAVSEDVNSVSLEADYIFMRCIPHLDVEGRMTGNPTVVFATVCPLRKELADKIEDLLKELHSAGLAISYEDDGKQYLWFPGFLRHQVGLRADKEAQSNIPEPPTDLVRTYSGNSTE